MGSAKYRARLITEALGRRGRIDVLVNNAAAMIGGPFTEITPRWPHRIFEINFFAAFDPVQQLAP